MVDEERKKSRVSMMVSKGAPGSMANAAGKLYGIKSMSRMRMRRMSYGFGRVSGIRTVDRSSQVGAEFKRPPLLFLSTYQLDPHPDEVFDVTRVTRMANNVVNILWKGHKYEASASPALALRISGETMRKVKNMSFNRYRVISVVTIGQKRAQCYNNAISFLWDHERDHYIDIQKESITNFIQVTIFGIYLD